MLYPGNLTAVGLKTIKKQIMKSNCCTLLICILFLSVPVSIYAFDGSSSWSGGWENQKVFIENRGQFPVTGAKDASVLYAYDNSSELIYFTRNGFWYDLMQKTRKEENEYGEKEEFRNEKEFIEHEKEEHRAKFRHDRIGITWAGANPAAEIVAEGMVSDYYNYAIKENGQSYSIDGLHAYTKLTYKNLYPNIDLEFVFHKDNGIKYSIIVRPGGNVADVQMLYSGMKKLNIKSNGDLHITTIFGDITDQAPLTFYQNDPSATIESHFVKSGKTISFLLGNYDPSKTIVIDPWQSTSGLGFGNSNKIWECEHDNSANSYFWGGDSPMKLKKYNAAGALQWTYTSPWDSANFWIGTMITDNNGNSFCTGGSNGEIAKVNTSGSQVWYNNPNGLFGPLFEYWHLTFNCDQTQLIIGGMRAPNPFSISNYRGVVITINMGTGAVTGFTPVGYVAGLTIKEVRSLCSAPNGNYYFLTLDSIGMVNSSIALQWKSTSGYNFGYGIPSYGVTNQGISSIRANASYIYTQDGNTLDQRSTANGAILNSAAIPGGISTSSFGVNTPGNSGLDIDSCGYIYVGSGNAIIKYDPSLNIVTSVSTPAAVYDVSVSKNGEVVACGNGFIGTYNMSACAPMQAICTTNSPLSATSVQTNVNCNGQCTGSSTVTPAGGSGTYTYSWAPSGGSAATASSLCAGTYTCTISDGSTSTNVTVTITQPTAISASASSTPASCSGNNGTATVTASGGTGTLTYSWAPSGGTSATASNLAAGGYTCTITDANGCTTTASTTVTNSGGPTASLQSSNDITCFGSANGSATVSASGNGPFTYSWAPSGGSAATASNLGSGTFTCTITDNNGCTTTQSVTITEPSQVTGSAVSTPATCGGNDGTATVTASGGTGTLTYSWSPSGGTAATENNLAAGGYTCTITDANGCTNTASVTVTSAGGPTVSLQSSNDLTCFGSGNGDATVTASGNGPFTYSWSPSGGTAATASNLAAGSYTCTITDSNGCISTQSVAITEPAQVAGTTSSIAASCGNNNGSATVTASGGTGAYTYSWAPSGGTATTASNLAAGSYTCTITDANGCSGTATVSVANSNGPTVTLQASSNVTCFNGSNGSATVSATGSGPFTYSWSPSGGTGATASNLTAGSYTCTITDSNGCISTQTVTITQPATGITSTSTSTPEDCGAGDGTASVTASGGTPSYTYSWSSGGTSATENNLNAGTYTCVITDANGCTSSSTVAVGGTGSATANAGPSATITQGQSVTLNGSGGGTYLWSPATGLSCTICPNPVASPTITTVYTLTVTDTNGCTATDTLIIYVDIACGELYLPNAFSPNGDNENDILYVRGNCIQYLQFDVYNRWGEKVFSTTDPALGWDGSWRGKPCEAAVFSYVLRATLLDGTEIEKQGSITLVK